MGTSPGSVPWRPTVAPATGLSLVSVTVPRIVPDCKWGVRDPLLSFCSGAKGRSDSVDCAAGFSCAKTSWTCGLPDLAIESPGSDIAGVCANSGKPQKKHKTRKTMPKMCGRLVNCSPKENTATFPQPVGLKARG